MLVKELKQKLEAEDEEHEVSVGLDIENGSIVASLSVYRPDEDEVADLMTEEYHIMGFSTERKGN